MTPKSPFFGRHGPLATLDAALADARAGRSRLVLVVADAGVGKTRLVAHWLDSVSDADVIRVAADPDELTVELSTAEQVLREVDPGRRPHGVVETGTALLEALSAPPGSGDVLVVVVDDLHWVDPSSVSALAFALRRLRHHRLLVVATARAAELSRVPNAVTRLADQDGGERLELAGLEEAETAALVLALTGHRIDPVTLRDLQMSTGGNPMWIRSVVERPLRPEEPLKAGPTLAAAFVDRVQRLSPPAREMLAALAILGGDQPVVRAARLAGAADVWTCLDELVAAGVVTGTGDVPDVSISFTHPLMGPSIADALGFARRRELHAAAIASSATAVEALRHEVASADGPDADLADRVLAHGRALAGEGLMLEAATWLDDAAALTPTAEEREERRLESAHTALLGGFQGAARAALTQLEDRPSGHRDFLYAWQAWLRGDLEEARALALAAAGSGDPRAEGGAALILAQVALVSDQGTESVTWGRRAERAGGFTQDLARSAVGGGLLLLGRSAEAVDVLGPPPAEPHPSQIAAEGVRGIVLMCLDRPAEARAALTAASAAVKRHRHFHLASVPLANLGMLENRTGNWPEATLALEQALAYAETFDEQWALGVVHGLAAYVPARRGEFGLAREHVDAAVRSAERRAQSGRIYAAVGAVGLAEAQGDVDRVIESGSWLAGQPDTAAVWLPNLFPWASLYVDALVAVGRLPDARVLERRIQAAADRCGGPSGQVEANRVSGLVALARGDVDAARRLLTDSADDFDALEMPFEGAWSCLKLGAASRRHGLVEAGVRELEQAAVVFRRLGAAPFLERAQRELDLCRRSGTVRVGRTPEAPPRLTAKELVVANLVAAGLSNREIAAEMFLSVRTVEFHLAGIYRKWDLRSRSQLVAHLLSGRA